MQQFQRSRKHSEDLAEEDICFTKFEISRPVLLRTPGKTSGGVSGAGLRPGT